MKNCRRTQKYGLHYTTSPGKSYIIEPDGNELDYRKAYKDPLGFYDQVMTQQVTQHTAKDVGVTSHGHKVELTTKRCQRKIGQVLMLVQTQFIEFFKGKWSTSELKAAFNDSNVKAAVQKHMKEENIKILKKDSMEPVFRRELTLIGQHGDNADKIDEDDAAEEPHTEPEDAQLHVDSRAFEEVKDEIGAFIKRSKTLV